MAAAKLSISHMLAPASCNAIFNLHGDSPCRVSRTGVQISLRKVSSCHTLMAQYWTVQSGTEVKLLQRHFPSLNQHLLLEEEAASERCAMYQQ